MFKFVEDVVRYPFLFRALMAGIFISVSVAILGVVLVLKRYSMIGDGLSHVGFSAFSISSALNWAPFLVSIPVVVFVAVLLLLLNENSSKIKSDSFIALLSNSCLSFGIIIISKAKGFNVDVLNYMFGSILALKKLDLILSVVFSFCAVFLFVFLYNKIFSITFDEDFAKAVGIKVRIYKLLIEVLISLVVVVAMKMVGALLISSLIIFPVLSVNRLFNCYRKIIIFSAVDSVFCFVVGFFLSYIFSIPTGATVVFVNFLMFCFCFIFSIIKKIFKKKSFSC